MLSRTLTPLAALATLAAVAGVAGPGPGDAHAGEPASDPTRILIIGDSVTNGSVGDWTWRYRLWNNLTGPGGADVDFVGPNVGVLDGEADTINAMEYADPDFDVDHAARWGMSLALPDHPAGDLVAAYGADVVIEHLGLNDLTWLRETPEAVAGLARRLVTDARAASPDVSVVLCQLPQTWIGKTAEYNRLIEDVAAELDDAAARVVVAEAPDPFLLDVDTWDLAHPSAMGEVKIARSVAEALADVGVGTAPEVFPQVVNGPAEAPVLASVQTHGIDVGLTWSGALGATGVRWWWRDVTAEGDWLEVREPGRVAVRPGQVSEWRVQAFKGAAVSPLFSNVVRLSRPPRTR